MKKTNLLKGAVALLAATVIFSACSNGTISSAIDTVDTLGTPSVKAVAYPGINYVTWGTVKGAQGYKVTKVINDIEYVVNDGTTSNYLTDIINQNGLKVTYKVQALSNTNPTSRAVYIYDSECGSAELTTIFPKAGTLATDLPKYESDSNWDFTDGAANDSFNKKDFVVTKDNVAVTDITNAKGKLAGYVVSTPVTPYYSTSVQASNGTLTYTGQIDESGATYIGGTSGYSTASYRALPLTAGDWTFKAVVSASNSVYQTAYIDLDKKVSIEALRTLSGTSISAAYVDSANVKVDIYPALALDGTIYPADNYTVYRYARNSTPIEEVAGTLTAKTTEEGVVYYELTDAVPSNAVSYTYYAQLADGDCMESYAASYSISAYSSYTVSNEISAKYNDDGDAIKLTVYPALKKDKSLYGVDSYTVYRMAENETEWTKIETALTATKDSDANDIYVLEDSITNNKLKYTYKVDLVKEDGYTTYTTYTVSAYSASSNAGVSTYVWYNGNGETIRVAIYPSYKKDKITLYGVEDYTVYRMSELESEWTKVTTALTADKTTGGSDVYYLDDVITNNKLSYTYKIVLAKENGATTYATYNVRAFTENTETADCGWLSITEISALDSDGLKNDITWYLSGVSSYTDLTFKAYLLTRDVISDAYGNYSYYTDYINEITTNGTEVKFTQRDAWDSAYYGYTKDVTGMAYLYVIWSQPNKKDYVTRYTYDTTTTPTVALSDVSFNNKTYDDTVTAATESSYVRVCNDELLEVTDTLTVMEDEIAIDSIDNYSYEIFRAKSGVSTSNWSTGFTWNINSTAWESICTLTLKDAEVYDTTDTTRTFKASFEDKDLADGYYLYKLVKTNKVTNVSATYGNMCYVYINTSNVNIEHGYAYDYYADWAATETAKPTTNDIEIAFVYFDYSPEAVYGTDELADYPVNYKGISEEEGVTYTLYRETVNTLNRWNNNDEVEVVFEKVADITEPLLGEEESYTVYALKDGEVVEKENPVKVYTSLEYDYVDKGLDTAKTYNYVVVATKEGTDPVVVMTATVDAIVHY